MRFERWLKVKISLTGEENSLFIEVKALYETLYGLNRDAAVELIENYLQEKRDDPKGLASELKKALKIASAAANKEPKPEKIKMPQELTSHKPEPVVEVDLIKELEKEAREAPASKKVGVVIVVVVLIAIIINSCWLPLSSIFSQIGNLIPKSAVTTRAPRTIEIPAEVPAVVEYDLVMNLPEVSVVVEGKAAVAEYFNTIIFSSTTSLHQAVMNLDPNSQKLDLQSVRQQVTINHSQVSIWGERRKQEIDEAKKQEQLTVKEAEELTELIQKTLQLYNRWVVWAEDIGATDSQGALAEAESFNKETMALIALFSSYEVGVLAPPDLVNLTRQIFVVARPDQQAAARKQLPPQPAEMPVPMATSKDQRTYVGLIKADTNGDGVVKHEEAFIVIAGQIKQHLIEGQTLQAEVNEILDQAWDNGSSLDDVLQTWLNQRESAEPLTAPTLEALKLGVCEEKQPFHDHAGCYDWPTARNVVWWFYQDMPSIPTNWTCPSGPNDDIITNILRRAQTQHSYDLNLATASLSVAKKRLIINAKDIQAWQMTDCVYSEGQLLVSVGDTDPENRDTFSEKAIVADAALGRSIETQLIAEYYTMPYSWIKSGAPEKDLRKVDWNLAWPIVQEHLRVTFNNENVEDAAWAVMYRCHILYQTTATDGPLGGSCNVDLALQTVE